MAEPGGLKRAAGYDPANTFSNRCSSRILYQLREERHLSKERLLIHPAGHEATVDGQGLAVDEAGGLGGEEDRGAD